jgi:ankyrin repeat protein
MYSEIGKSARKRTHLMYASMKGDVERVRWLLARGAPAELTDIYWRTALWWAARSQRAGADVEAADIPGFMSLFIASQFGCAEVLEVLITAGADVQACADSTSGRLLASASEMMI